VQRQSLILGLTYFRSTILQSFQELLTLTIGLDAALGCLIFISFSHCHQFYNLE